ncbi:MAG: hypothetical protein LBH30_05605 [Prevotellaceae bacterium]|nr:hypothetical protein [Prevotellaceae bacterium]
MKKLAFLLAFFVIANNVFGQQETCVTIPQIQSVESVSASDVNCAGGDVTLNLLINKESVLSDNFINEVNKALKDAGIDYITASGTAPFENITLTFSKNYTDSPDVKNLREIVFTATSQNCSSGIKVIQESCSE